MGTSIHPSLSCLLPFYTTLGLVLNAWFNDCVLCFFAYIANSMIACVDAAAYGVLLLLRVRILEELAILI